MGQAISPEQKKSGIEEIASVVTGVTLSQWHQVYGIICSAPLPRR